MGEIQESNSNAITGLDVTDGVGNEAETATPPILMGFSGGLESQIVSNPS